MAKVPEKDYTELPCDPATALLGIHPELKEGLIDIYMPMFNSSIFTIVRRHPSID